MASKELWGREKLKSGRNQQEEFGGPPEEVLSPQLADVERQAAQVGRRLGFNGLERATVSRN